LRTNFNIEEIHQPINSPSLKIENQDREPPVQFKIELTPLQIKAKTVSKKHTKNSTSKKNTRISQKKKKIAYGISKYNFQRINFALL